MTLPLARDPCYPGRQAHTDLPGPLDVPLDRAATRQRLRTRPRGPREFLALALPVTLPPRPVIRPPRPPSEAGAHVTQTAGKAQTPRHPIWSLPTQWDTPPPDPVRPRRGIASAA
ncbi:hypothetical protein [Nonomuraea jiangxiensis]|uniref:hypothetical protein n=1 Tax=Nonomuraea jiangxiensis TaxID=633440 RepID=UPI00115F945B|nr:hypothetical protein [Nonomuraea jiangxiensis]